MKLVISPRDIALALALASPVFFVDMGFGFVHGFCRAIACRAELVRYLAETGAHICRFGIS
jgi:hypothetical protein